MFGNRGFFPHPSGASLFKVSLFNAPAEGQQVAVALDSLCHLRARESGGQNGEEVAKHQSVQFCRPVTHIHSMDFSWFYRLSQSLDNKVAIIPILNITFVLYSL